MVHGSWEEHCLPNIYNEVVRQTHVCVCVIIFDNYKIVWFSKAFSVILSVIYHSPLPSSLLSSVLTSLLPTQLKLSSPFLLLPILYQCALLPPNILFYCLSLAFNNSIHEYQAYPLLSSLASLISSSCLFSVFPTTLFLIFLPLFYFATQFNQGHSIWPWVWIYLLEPDRSSNGCLTRDSSLVFQNL